MILITGATGTVGSEVVKRLSAAGVQVRAVTRDPGKADILRLPQVDVVKGDFEDADTIRRACSGVKRAFLVTNSTERTEHQQIAFTHLAQHAPFYPEQYVVYEGVMPGAQPRAISKVARTTNHIERFNNTLRQQVSRLVREAWSFSKQLAHHIRAIKMFICHYNLTRAAAWSEHYMDITTKMRLKLSILLLCSVVVWPLHVASKVLHLQVMSRQDVLGGQAFGSAGPYEKLLGEVVFAVDPDNPLNTRIVDLAHAPRSATGHVEARANFMVLQPKQPQGGQRVALLDVSNRGGKAALMYFNGARYSLDPTLPEHFGDGLLMRHGLTLIWVGWQFDVPPQPLLLRLQVPIARRDGQPIAGLVRSDWTVDETVTTLPLGHRQHIAYPVTDPQHLDNVLTERDGRLAPRRIVPRQQWRFAREVAGEVVPDRTFIHMPTGFRAGKIYELVYRAQDPAVVGLGLAAVRDMMAFARYDDRSPFRVDYGIAFGVSQTGRFLRHFLYQGFNTDEQGRRVFDGMLIHTAGAGRGSFNHRFAQPSRDAHRYAAFFYPTDIFPFTSRTQNDPSSGRSDGLLAHLHHPDHAPKIFYTNTGYEYWGRAASLIHTTVDGQADVAPLPHERLYHLASAQHFEWHFPPRPGERLPDAMAYRGNPLRFLVNLRALLLRLVDWVVANREPPPHAYPRLADQTLVAIDQVRFPAIPGVSFPRVIHEAYRVDYGPHWPAGIVTYQPPRLGPAFPTLVAQVDAMGNEATGIRNIEILVPVATYTPWLLRTGAVSNSHELTDFLGTYIPLPRTEADRQRLGDPRPSLETLYATREAYLRHVNEAAVQLVAHGYLLAEDVERVRERAMAQWEWVRQRH